MTSQNNLEEIIKLMVKYKLDLLEVSNDGSIKMIKSIHINTEMQKEPKTNKPINKDEALDAALFDLGIHEDQ